MDRKRLRRLGLVLVLLLLTGLAKAEGFVHAAYQWVKQKRQDVDLEFP